MLCSFRDGWVDIGGVPSHVLTWGGWIDDPLPPGGTVLLFMCGVPGLTFFYKTFLEELYNRLKIPVWTICIAGHELPPRHSGLSLTKSKSRYDNVRAQATHKKEFVNKYLPPDKKVILVGHSFGGKMVLELLKDEELENRTEKCFLLMPTIERFADLPRARFWLKICNLGIIYLIVLFVWLLSLLPLSWRRKYALWYFHSRGFKNVDEHCVDAMAELSGNTELFNNVRALVYDELEAVKELDVGVLRKISDRTKVFFAMNDYWAPLTHYHSLKVAVPRLEVEILDSEFKHAFSVTTPHNMADIIVGELHIDHIQVCN
ncbi:lipid droplet-associated hydrolase-like [Macrosteles quadrilineatus]|uniref:lipid droplet-associated hydrolase-like n=1 Tax=Macrosteles quadrilineatus TaxID=74068 RepID=UPI0023E2C6CE|nr:lipid droplet-associated hydrolase-like [Macrosteles quadrilineatus]